MELYWNFRVLKGAKWKPIWKLSILELYYNAKHSFREYKNRNVCANAEIAGRALAARQGIGKTNLTDTNTSATDTIVTAVSIVPPTELMKQSLTK